MFNRSVKFHHLLYQEDVTTKYLVVPLGFEMTVGSAGDEPSSIKIMAKPTRGHNFMQRI